ncbi:MAG: sialidase family protein [Bryobacteraceae bacterium]
MLKILAIVVLGAAALQAQVGRPQVVVSGDGYFPVLIRLSNGEALAVLRGGAPHVGVKGRLDLVSSKDGGQTWSKPWVAIDEQYDDRNPAFGQLKDGTILLGYVIAKGYDASGLKFTGARKDRVFEGVYLIRSRDNGKTWSKPSRDETIYKFYAGSGHVSPYGKIVQLKDGTVLMTVYFEFFDGRQNESYLFRSKDNGKTWGSPALMGKHYNETAIQILPDGRLLAAMRSEPGGHLAVTESNDQGKTWSAPVQVTKDSEHPADLIVLKDGRILMTYGERNAPRGVHAMISKDGRSWDKTKDIVLANDAPNTDCGYPSSIEVAPGKILTMYYQVDDLKNAPASAKAKSILWTAPR